MMRRRLGGSIVSSVALVVVIGAGLTACGSSKATKASSGATTSSTAAGTTGSPGYATTVTSGGAVNPAAVPLGDGDVATSPKIGYVDACQTSFGGIGGAQAVGPWLNTKAKTWDSVSKIAVAGSVSWPTASYTASISGDQRVIQTNDLPIDHTTGIFPVASGDPAYAYDRNPNSIATQSIDWSLPASPVAAASPSCTPGGAIGVLDDGVLLFNALDGEGRDAGAHEVLDACGEHPQMGDMLHHHLVPSCILDKTSGSSTLVGYAIDGYGIFAERDAGGALLTNTGLDACHGRTSTVLWNGQEQSIYHYDATFEYPYTVGCFHGTPINTGSAG
jgi:hypothetical protein